MPKKIGMKLFFSTFWSSMRIWFQERKQTKVDEAGQLIDQLSGNTQLIPRAGWKGTTAMSFLQNNKATLLGLHSPNQEATLGQARGNSDSSTAQEASKISLQIKHFRCHRYGHLALKCSEIQF